MIRLYQYEEPEKYRDFQNYLFSYPYGFLFDFPADKVTIHKVAYRISSLQRVPDNNQVVCICSCAGGSGIGTGSFHTDVSLHGESSEALPLGVQLSKKAGNKLQILDDGCFVGGDPAAYSAPKITLSASKPADHYLTGEVLSNVVLTVTVTKGSEDIKDVRLLYNSSNVLHVFTDISAGTKTYRFTLEQSMTDNIAFRASCSDDSQTIYSGTLEYKFHLPVYAGISGSMEPDTETVQSGVLLKITTGSSFSHSYAQFNTQHIWLARDKNKPITLITDENGFNITAAFVKTNLRLTIGGKTFDYTLYVFDTPATGADYKVTFNS